MVKLFALILFSLPYFLFAQQRKAFKIIGHAVFYNDQQLAIQGGVLSASNKYNDFNFVTDIVDTVNNSFKIVKVQNNQFTINGFQKYPHPFSFSYYDAEKNQGSSSDFFFIDGGTVNIEINDLSANRNAESLLQSKSNKEYQYLKKLYSHAIDTVTGEIHDLKGKQKTMHKYINENPDSYVALWDMVIDYAINKNYRNNDDRKSLLKNAQLFSPAIKKTGTYRELVKNINQDLSLSGGKTFPNISFNTFNPEVEMAEDKVFPNIPMNSMDSLLTIIKKNKFTLLDFWFSSCKPCIEQFPRYKIIYDQHKSSRFEIIGISVDSKEDRANWQNTIKKHNLNWLQYLDTDEITTRKLNINIFPTNYLLDSNGKIIKKNISQEDLESFLLKNLN